MCAQHKCPEPRLTKTPLATHKHTAKAWVLPGGGAQKRQLPQDPGGEEGNKAWEGARKTS